MRICLGVGIVILLVIIIVPAGMYLSAFLLPFFSILFWVPPSDLSVFDTDSSVQLLRETNRDLLPFNRSCPGVILDAFDCTSSLWWWRRRSPCNLFRLTDFLFSCYQYFPTLCFSPISLASFCFFCFFIFLNVLLFSSLSLWLSYKSILYRSSMAGHRRGDQWGLYMILWRFHLMILCSLSPAHLGNWPSPSCLALKGFRSPFLTLSEDLAIALIPIYVLAVSAT